MIKPKLILLIALVAIGVSCSAQAQRVKPAIPNAPAAPADGLPDFIHTDQPVHLDTKNLTKGGAASACYPQIVVYDPCCNSWKVLYSKAGNTYAEVDRLHYKQGKGRVIFIINNYNTLKYNATLSTSYVNNWTDVPAAWQTILAGIMGGANGNNLVKDNPEANKENPETNMVAELKLIMKLYLQLRSFMLMDCISCSADKKKDCSDFEAEKKFTLRQILSTFKSYDITAHYANSKQDYISNTDPAPTNDNFNQYFAQKYLINLLPDSLVSYTQSLINTLVNTSFYSQFNIPQLQNADKLVFTVGLQPNSGTNGILNVPNQTISVPIGGGWKWDWSTGFYYSNIRNESYALKPTSPADTANTIVNENGIQGGTLGVAVLLHAYPRTGYPVNAGFVLGLGKSLDVNYSVLAGGSLMIGRDNRFAISSGLDVSSIKALSASQSVNLQLPATAAINYYSKFRAGFFLSFTYAFSVSQSTQTASASPSPPGGTSPGGGDAASPTGGAPTGGAAAAPSKPGGKHK